MAMVRGPQFDRLDTRRARHVRDRRRGRVLFAPIPHHRHPGGAAVHRSECDDTTGEARRAGSVLPASWSNWTQFDRSWSDWTRFDRTRFHRSKFDRTRFDRTGRTGSWCNTSKLDGCRSRSGPHDEAADIIGRRDCSAYPARFSPPSSSATHAAHVKAQRVAPTRPRR